MRAALNLAKHHAWITDHAASPAASLTVEDHRRALDCAVSCAIISRRIGPLPSLQSRQVHRAACKTGSFSAMGAVGSFRKRT
jgi:hypothetical protein